MKNPKFSDMPKEYVSVFQAINPSQEALHIMYNQCVGRMQNFTDISDASIEAIKNPALIIIGDRDVPTPEHAVEMYRRMPNASIAIFPGGHGTFMGEITTLSAAHNPLVALPVIEDFLK